MNPKKNTLETEPLHIKPDITISTTEKEINVNFKFNSTSDKIVFHKFLTMLSKNNDQHTGQGNYISETIALTPARLNHVITRWYPIRNGYKKMEMITDVIDKVKAKEIGTYYYQCRYSKYKLDINEDGSCLYDLLKKKAYYFAE